MRLIDADALIEKCGDWYVEEGPEEGFIGTLEQLLSEQPEINCSEIPNNSDTISRQAAIDKITKRLFETAFSNVGIKQNIDETLVDVAENRLENWFNELPSIQLGTNLAEVGTDLATRRTVKGFPIDADLLMLKAEEKYGCRTRDRLYEMIRYMPKYEYPERKKGTWTKDASCPFCGFKPWYERDIHTLSFCPNCGADLRGEVNGQK